MVAIEKVTSQQQITVYTGISLTAWDFFIDHKKKVGIRIIWENTIRSWTACFILIPYLEATFSFGPPALLWIVWTTSKKEGSQLVQTHKRNVKQNWETALLMAENVLFKGTNTRKITATKFLTLTLLIAIHNLHHHTKNVYIRNIFMFMYISYFALSPSLLSFPRTNMHLCISRSGGQMAGWLYVCVYEWPHTANNSHQSSLEAPRLTQIRTALRDDNKRYRVIASLLSTSHFLSIIILSFRFPPF